MGFGVRIPAIVQNDSLSLSLSLSSFSRYRSKPPPITICLSYWFSDCLPSVTILTTTTTPASVTPNSFPLQSPNSFIRIFSSSLTVRKPVTMSFICGGMYRPHMMKLDIEMEILAAEMEELLLLNNTVRSELRRNGGHKGKVNAKLLDWLDHVDRIEKQFTNIWYSYLSLVGLVRFIQISPSSVLVFFASREVFEEYRFSGTVYSFFPADFNKYNFSGAAAFPLVEKIKDKIWEYLDDPLIRTVSFYGGEWIKHKIINQIKIESFVHKIARVKVFQNTNLNDLQHHIRKKEGAEAYKCLVLFDYESIWEQELFGNIKRQILNLGNIYSCSSVSKIKKQILNLTNEVEVLAGSNASLQVLHDDNGAHTVAGRFSMRQTLTGQLTREISSNILEYVLDPTIGTIGLYGAVGVGKTTIVKNICNELANTDTFDTIIWVSLSEKEFYNTQVRKRLQDEIALQLGLKLLGYENPHERASRISEKLKIVGKCLFILDDAWERVNLNYLGIPYPKRDNGCKIVLTTRIRDVCTAMNVQKMIYLAPLSENEAWDLFVIKSGDQVFDPQMESIAKKIVYECGGLPITITTVCHVMKDKVDMTAWRLALKELQSKNSQNYGKGHLLDVLLFCIKHLKNDRVRLCFLYCSIFPEDYKFDSTELIRYWIAENLIHTSGGIVESLNNGLEILKELKDASMLETFMEGGIEWIKMHDLFRDIAIRILMVELDFLVKAGIDIREFPFTQNGKISLIRNSIVKLPDTHPPLLMKLSTLLLRDSPLKHIPHSFFSSMPNLQVLDMSHSGLNQMPQSLSILRKLRVLFLDFCTGLEKFPTLEKLEDLQFLSLRGTLIKELPQGMGGLVNLISLNLSETIRLKHIKAGVISSLSNLEELQLQGSHLCKMESLEVTNLFKEISCLKQLGILRLSAVGFGGPLDTILHLQQHNLKIFSVTAYGSPLDYMEDE